MKNIILYIFMVVSTAACSTSPDFSSVAFGNNTVSVQVIKSKSKVVDNLFKSEYVYLIVYNENKESLWLSSLDLTPYDEQKDGQPGLKKYLINYFPNEKLEKSESSFYHLGESPDGREHYLLVFKQKGLAIYYVATV